MGQHKFNPVAVANSAPQMPVRLLKLGDTGYGMLGLGLEGRVVDGKFQVCLFGSFARISEIMPINAIAKLPLAMAVNVDLTELTAKIAAQLDEPKDELSV